MRQLSKFTTATALVIAAGTFVAISSPAFAMSDACMVKDKRFVCADGSKNSKKIAMALANPATVENLKSAGPGHKILTNPKERELYRRSVEKARKSAKMFADRSFRQFKRRRMSAKNYEAVRAQFETGMANYDKALDLFRSQDWFSPSRDKNAEGSD